jgi:hypothetical protein
MQEGRRQRFEAVSTTARIARGDPQRVSLIKKQQSGEFFAFGRANRAATALPGNARRPTPSLARGLPGSLARGRWRREV